MHVWKPPSFDAPLPPLPEPLSFDALSIDEASVRRMATALNGPSPQELQAVRAKAHQDGFVRGLQEGLAEGRLQGESLGREEGIKSGTELGHAEGLAQGLQDGRERVDALCRSLQQSIDNLVHLPMALENSLTDWVYQTASRLAGQESMGREPFVQAVQEALMRMPRPGETLFLRISPQDLGLWQKLVQDAPAGMAVTLLEDLYLQAGHAYLEVAGTRVDVGTAARDALVRSALGLLPVAADSRG